jgi:uncharacterized protein (TIGR03067 family)
MNFRSVALPLTAFLALTVATVAAQTTTPPARAKLIASLQGTWLMTVSNGQDLAGSGQEILITITDDKYAQTVNGTVVERGSYKLDETKKPMTVDLAITEGDDAGMTQLGVVEVDGKTMYGKLAKAGVTTRPTDFATAEGFDTFTAVNK